MIVTFFPVAGFHQVDFSSRALTLPGLSFTFIVGPACHECASLQLRPMNKKNYAAYAVVFVVLAVLIYLQFRTYQHFDWANSFNSD